MKAYSENGTPFAGTMLTASILLAQIDLHGITDYGLKAVLGGAIWLAFRLLADRIDRTRKGRPQQGKSTTQGNPND